MSLRIVCGDPDHMTRAGKKGWSKTLGIFGDPSEPIEGDTVRDGMLCGACGRAWAAEQPELVADPDALRALRDDIESASTLDGLKQATLAFIDATTPTE